MTALLALAGVASLAYGAAMAALYPAGGFFLVWLVMGSALVALSWAVGTGRWGALSRAARLAACGLGAALALGTVALASFIMLAAAAPAPAGLDYVIVLGAGLRPDGTPSEALRFRLDAALGYLEENEGTICVVSGGQGFGEVRTEASSMAEYLLGRGLAPERLVLEEHATTTFENIEYSLPLVGDGASSVGIVTNDFHVCRALGVARSLGLGGACGIAAPSNPLYLPQSLLRECVAVVRDAAVR